MHIYAGRTTPYCDGMRRRSFVQLGVAGMASLGMGRLLQAAEQFLSVISSYQSSSPPVGTRCASSRFFTCHRTLHGTVIQLFSPVGPPSGDENLAKKLHPIRSTLTHCG